MKIKRGLCIVIIPPGFDEISKCSTRKEIITGVKLLSQQEIAEPVCLYVLYGYMCVRHIHIYISNSLYITYVSYMAQLIATKRGIILMYM